MGLKQTTAPATEPVTLAEAKAHLRVSDTTDDALITSLISAARQQVEIETRRQLVTATYRFTLNEFPGGCGEIIIPKPPMYNPNEGDGSGSGTDTDTGVTITYVDGDGDVQTLAASAYVVRDDLEPARITLAYGESWPIARYERDAVRVAFQAGYGAAASVPDALKAAIKLLVGGMYENRESITDVTLGEMPAVARLINLYRIPEVF